MQMPLTIKETLSEIVLINRESYLLGITLAVLTLLEELIETESDPILSEPSANRIKSPFSNETNFKEKILLLLVLTCRMISTSVSFILT